MRQVGLACRRCGALGRLYYDERNTWAVCLVCRVGAWVGTGWRRPPSAIDPALLAAHYSDIGAPPPPSGAIYTAAPFWTEVS